MTAGAAAAITRVAADVRAIDGFRTETAAFAVAESGLERYLGGVGPLVDDTTILVSGGRARVRATLIRPAQGSGDTAVYVINSEGVVAGPGGKLPEGRRSVAQLAWRIGGRLPVARFWTALGGLESTGAADTLTDADACLTDTIAAIARERVPSPPAEGPGTAMTTATSPASRLGFDWSALADPRDGTLAIDAVICFPGTPGFDSRWSPCGSWPSAAAWRNADYWPTIVINGSYIDLPHHGRGVLIVTGDLTLRGGDRWDGVVMVGNRLLDSGGGAIRGAVFSGLDRLNGEPVDVSRTTRTKTYRLDSCRIARAADRQSRWSRVPNAWMDNGSW